MHFEVISKYPESDTDLPRWRGGARGYWSYDWDEWVRSGASWDYEKTLLDDVHHPYGYNALAVKLELSIHGVQKGRRYRPTHWAAHLTVGAHRLEIGKGRCKSVTEARRLADEIPKEEAIKDLLRQAYVRPAQISFIFRLREDVIPKPQTWPESWEAAKARRELLTKAQLNPNNWEPYWTHLRVCNSDVWQHLPNGIYLDFGTSEYDAVWVVDRTYYGWSGSGSPELKAMIQQMPSWPPPRGSESS